MTTRTLEQYLEAAKRENTQRSYASDLRHFEVVWGGLLPATAQSTAEYLAAYAGTLSVSTLRRRLAALAQWHRDHGFADPTTAALVKKTLKGIRTVHPAEPRQAEPLQLAAISQITAWLDAAIDAAKARRDTSTGLRHCRDKALLLLGFWRGFRTDELIHLQIQHVTVVPSHGMTLFLPSAKHDRQAAGTSYRVPALSRLCPVTATLDWIAATGCTSGPLFRGIDQWGTVSFKRLHPNSVAPLLRRLFAQAGLPSPEAYSGHSLRRGFAGWANANGWDLKALMEYVGWKDVKSALRYIDTPDAFGQHRIEHALSAPARGASETPSDKLKPPSLPAPAPSVFKLTLHLRTTPRRGGRRSAKLRKIVESICLAPHQAIALDHERTRYALTIEAESDTALGEVVSSLIEDLYRVADNHEHDADVSVAEDATDHRWT